MADGWRFKKGNPAYDRYIHSAAWREKADARLEKDKHICRVCGKAAADVHHLTYDRFGHEDMDDLVSLCRNCHEKAEELYDPAVIPWAMDMKKAGGNNAIFGKWKDVVAELGISNGTLTKLKTDDGTSFGPSLRESVLYYCGLDAAAGIAPLDGFKCLTDEDYARLNALADYMRSVSGEGRFRGEYVCAN